MAMKVSVIITSFNQKKYLVEAIESVINQTYQPYEIIIADDCSTDGSQVLIKEYVKQHPTLLRAFFHKANLGIPNNRNFSLKKVNGDLISFLDGDDRLLPKKIESEIEILERHPEVSLVFSNYYYIDEFGQRTGLWAKYNSPPSGYVFKDAFSRNWPNNSLYRNELVDFQALKQIGFYNGTLQHPYYEDWDLKIRFTNKFKVAYCPIPLAEYRIHQISISKKANSESHLKAIKNIYKINSHLLENLSASDRLEVEKKLFNLFNRLEILATLEKGHKMVAIRRHLSTLKKNPVDFINYKFLFRLILPDNIRKLISIAFRKFKRRPC
jgi:glycosyltransferase involved in cell wall biosynthesis